MAADWEAIGRPKARAFIAGLVVKKKRIKRLESLRGLLVPESGDVDAQNSGNASGVQVGVVRVKSPLRHRIP
jgi:hypothetical protein